MLSASTKAGGESALLAVALWLLKRFGPRLAKRYLKVSGGWIAVAAFVIRAIMRQRARQTRKN